MGRKSRANQGKSAGVSVPDGAGNVGRDEPTWALGPLFDSALDATLFGGTLLVVLLVALWFQTDVNRVFDVPKALALKVGGGSLALVWAARAFLGRGYSWASARLFLAPAAAVLATVAASTLFSLDPWISFAGVYERQFGLQGQFACFMIFLITATTLRSRRGALLGFAGLLVIGAVMSYYGWLQALGRDPLNIFQGSRDKVYSTLGNATFAGNALALIAPLGCWLAVAAAAGALRSRPGAPQASPALRGTAFAAGAAGTVFLMMVPAYLTAADPGWTWSGRSFVFKLGVTLVVLTLVCAGALGTLGPRSTRRPERAGRQLADAIGAGILVGCAVGIGVGLLVTRTRGAWVGTFVAALGGTLLLPMLFSDRPQLARRLRLVGGAAFVSLFVGLAGFMLLYPKHLYTQTILSIPHAFNPAVRTYGQGQGTRRYLWAESPRVLLHHDRTLKRRAQDDADRRAQQIVAPEPKALETSFLRRALVFPFGIGIEAYRYAFMSHKSKELEALDPMTNHDNPHNNYLYVLASSGLFGIAAYLWLLARLLGVAWRHFRAKDRPERGRAERAVAFGVVTSFFSYAVYSIAGFDSVACSVFLYFILGASAAFFSPSEDTPHTPVRAAFVRRFATHLPSWGPGALSAGAGLALVLLALSTIFGMHTTYRAERAFVGDTDQPRTFDTNLKNIQRAIEINPREAFYRQSLGTALLSAGSRFGQALAEMKAPDPERTKLLAEKQSEFLAEAERAFFSALAHSWAPENTYISLFQLYYAWGKRLASERALERALEHSPHLAPVRANLAVLEFARGARDEALANCRWVLEVEPRNLMGLRTCSQAALDAGVDAEARRYLTRAERIAPKDPAIRAALARLARGSTLAP